MDGYTWLTEWVQIDAIAIDIALGARDSLVGVEWEKRRYLRAQSLHAECNSDKHRTRMEKRNPQWNRNGRTHWAGLGMVSLTSHNMNSRYVGD